MPRSSIFNVCKLSKRSQGANEGASLVILLLGTWPESLFAYAPTWATFASLGSILADPRFGMAPQLFARALVEALPDFCQSKGETF